MDKDIFISYTHADNQPWGPEGDCWIKSFHSALESRLHQLLARPPVIWRDDKLSGTDKFGDEIIAQFPQTKVLLAVVSPLYFTSEWCTKERAEFLEAIALGASSDIGNSSRLCKVVKTHVPHDKQPKELSEVLGFEFYDKDEKEYKSYRESPLCEQYWDKLDELARELAKLLEKIDKVTIRRVTPDPIVPADEETLEQYRDVFPEEIKALTEIFSTQP